MSKEIKCTGEFDDWVRDIYKWVHAQEEAHQEPTPDKIEDIMRFFERVQEKGKEFASCEFKP